MTFIITAILLVCIGTVSGYFYRKHAAQVKPQPDGTIRAKLPGWYRFCGYFLVAGGVLFALITPALIRAVIRCLHIWRSGLLESA